MPAPLLVLELLAGLFGAAPELTSGAAGMATLVVIAAGALLLAVVAVGRTVLLPAGSALTLVSVRRRGERTAFLPLRDPDAAGRPRPRAPSICPRGA